MATADMLQDVNGDAAMIISAATIRIAKNIVISILLFLLYLAKILKIFFVYNFFMDFNCFFRFFLFVMNGIRKDCHGRVFKQS